jgi:hypothetical protein
MNTIHPEPLEDEELTFGWDDVDWEDVDDVVDVRRGVLTRGVGLDVAMPNWSHISFNVLRLGR